MSRYPKGIDKTRSQPLAKGNSGTRRKKGVFRWQLFDILKVTDNKGNKSPFFAPLRGVKPINDKRVNAICVMRKYAPFMLIRSERSRPNFIICYRVKNRV